MLGLLQLVAGGAKLVWLSAFVKVASKRIFRPSWITIALAFRVTLMPAQSGDFVGLRLFQGGVEPPHSQVLRTALVVRPHGGRCG